MSSTRGEGDSVQDGIESLFALERMNAASLEEEQIAYELACRVTAGGASDQTGTPVERLQRLLEQDIMDRRDPLDWTLDLTNEQCEEEVTKSYTAVERLTARTDQCYTTPSLVEIGIIESQLIHYYDRLRRINVEGGGAELINRHRESLSAIMKGMGEVETIKAALRTLSASRASRFPNETAENVPKEPEKENPLSSTLTDDTLNKTHFEGMKTPAPRHMTTAQKQAERRELFEEVLLIFRFTQKAVNRWSHGYEYMDPPLSELQAKIQTTRIEVTKLQSMVTTAEPELVTKLSEMYWQVIGWQQAVKAEQDLKNLCENTTPAGEPAQSTMRNVKNGGGQRNSGPFVSRINAMSLDDTQNSEALGVDRPTPSVRFTNDKTGGLTTALRGGGGKEEQARLATESSRLWPPMESEKEHTHNNYHPSIPNVQREGVQNRTVTLAQNEKPTDSARQWQYIQQSLVKALSHRKYDGRTADGQKTMTIDDFVGHLRAFQASVELSDSEILRSISSCMTGAAFTWWATNMKTIYSVDHLEVGSNENEWILSAS